MNIYFRQCFYTDKENHYIYVETPFVMAESEEGALIDLLQKYKDVENVVCRASFMQNAVIDEK